MLQRRQSYSVIGREREKERERGGKRAREREREGEGGLESDIGALSFVLSLYLFFLFLDWYFRVSVSDETQPFKKTDKYTAEVTKWGTRKMKV